jgi:transcriptional regulator with XRE-family HTH domain
MPDAGSASVAQQRLASELRRLRLRERRTGKDVAERLGWSAAKLSRIERGLIGVKPEDLIRLAGIYGLSDERTADLVALAEESREPDVIDELGVDLPADHAEFVRAENEAEAVFVWEPQMVPGLLQIEGYTRGLLGPWMKIFAKPWAELDRRVQTTRIRRQLLDRDPPLQVSVVIDESVLLRRFASASVMREQLLFLAEISRRDNLDLRILRLAQDQVVGTGTFAYFSFARAHGTPMQDRVALEHLHDTTFVKVEAEVNKYRHIRDELQRAALSQQASRDLLTSVARGRWS